MRRTPAQIEKAAKAAEAWLDELDPETTPADHIEDLRAIAAANDRLVAAQVDVTAAVKAARANDRSWAMIGRALGVTTQAAQQRYGTVKKKVPAKAAKRAPAKKSRVYRDVPIKVDKLRANT